MTSNDTLRDRIVAALDTAYERSGHRLVDTYRAHSSHQFSGACYVCQGDVTKLADVAAAVVQSEIERLREELNTAQLARECGWPGCTATYQADTGPHSEPWSRHRLPDITLCPVHAWGEHYPSSRIDGPASKRPCVWAACHCGWTDNEPVRTRDESAFRWQRHIVQSTGNQGGEA